MKTTTTSIRLIAVGINADQLPQLVTFLKEDDVVITYVVSMTIEQWTCADVPLHKQDQTAQIMATSILDRTERTMAAVVLSEDAWMRTQFGNVILRDVVLDLADEYGIEPPVFLVAYDDGHIEVIC
ncbi:hypothetical protein HJC99_01530 [Candidatus Saccharibacteria bacterium]|nr:hypothetical protein [Candidatus Saccharibacteria bacterium]